MKQGFRTLDRRTHLLFVERLHSVAGPLLITLPRVTVARRCGLDPGRFSQLYTGEVTPGIYALVQLSRGLNSTPNYLLGFDNETLTEEAA